MLNECIEGVQLISHMSLHNSKMPLHKATSYIAAACSSWWVTANRGNTTTGGGKDEGVCRFKPGGKLLAPRVAESDAAHRSNRSLQGTPGIERWRGSM